MKSPTLSPDQIDQFITAGYTVLREAFPAHVAGKRVVRKHDLRLLEVSLPRE